MADTPLDIDDAIAKAAPVARPILQEIRKRVAQALPEATETIAYQMPAFKMRKVFFYFAAFKRHIGIYPPLHNDSALQVQVAPYANAKGNLRFPLSTPLPMDLILRVAVALAEQYHPKEHATEPAERGEVLAFLAELTHPRLAEIRALRTLVLSVDPTVTECIKWKAPSFRTDEDFATMHLRDKAGIGLILHRGVKNRPLPEGGMAIPDPDGLLTWLAPDRARLHIADLAQLQERERAISALLVAWIQCL